MKVPSPVGPDVFRTARSGPVGSPGSVRRSSPDLDKVHRVTELPEIVLEGGAQSTGIVRVDGTVRRPAHRRSPWVQALLRHLEDVGFPGAPRALGFDDKGREVVSFVAGEVVHRLPFNLPDARLVSAAALVKGFHDATVSFPLRGDGEVVCHGDLGPHNTVFRGDTAVAVIDWDGDVRPGRRAVDFAHAVWCFADLLEPAVPVREQARRAALMCDGYPGMTPAVVVDELAARFSRARDHHEAAGRTAGVEVFERNLAWLDRHGARLAGA